MDFDDPEMAEALLEEMEEKEEQLRLAAEFGQTLLERTEELQEENEAMEREKEAAVAEAEEHEYRARELQDNLDRLAEEAASKDAALDEARAEVERKEAEMEEKLKAMEGNDEELAAAQEQRLELRRRVHRDFRCVICMEENPVSGPGQLFEISHFWRVFM